MAEQHEHIPYEVPELGELHWIRTPPKIFFEPHAIRYLAELKDLSKIFIVSDRMIYKLGYVNRVMDILRRRRFNVEIEIYIDVPTEPTIHAVEEALEVMRTFGPDNIIALGGGSVIDAAKVMWMLFEHPEIPITEIPTRFHGLMDDVFKNPKTGKKSRLIAVPTTSGTGSEVSPFCILVDDKTKKTYPLSNYCFIPSVAIVDPEFTITLPKRTIADNGLDILSHCIEAYTSKYSSDYSNSFALEALQMIFKNFRGSYNGEHGARFNMHNAATISGMATANGYNCVIHALAHKVADHYHIHHGKIAGILLPYVVRFNGSFVEEKYKTICLRTHIPLDGKNGTEALAQKCEQLLKETESTTKFRDLGIEKDDWEQKIQIIANDAVKLQDNGFNAKVATVDELLSILRAAY
ncbi:alcohol dehydrogenase, putative [Entamoeba invadens IP1]|uniref:Alcohol dehydrogenase, putative n=1 Tax=Entamoeba invadens IP1 TaxID=370355 RepID=A0A0A1TVU9_ENTIV|nr:alcohol dehydrogenase, putative [Entamoeba invadens IP1]ELP84561.1 alcohol dehydrogenase, putative [Entamoeba invadens IP1]|eukprot:XP_004183907.1 alcohol dehydrogenase, putative [Entamoeba invadens IP1]